MRTPHILRALFSATGDVDSFRPSGAQAGRLYDDLLSKSAIQNHKRSALELEWFLIGLLLLVYLAGSYLFWARIEFVWPFNY
jgi:hypothetical protein